MSHAEALAGSGKRSLATAGRRMRLPGIVTFAVLLAMSWGQAKPAFALAVVPANAIYVDLTLTSSYVTNYNPATRTAGSGTSQAYNTLAAAASAAVAGNTIVLRAGSYSQALNVASSGTPGNPITFAAYPGETPTITGSSLYPAIYVSGRNYIVFDSLTVQNVTRWFNAWSCSNIVVTGCTFAGPTDASGGIACGLFFQQCTFCRVVGNSITCSSGGQDLVMLLLSHQCVVQGNYFYNAPHSLFTIAGGCYNVLRNNYFSNPTQKIGEIYDLDANGFNPSTQSSPASYFTEHNCTKRNLVEGNQFALSPGANNTAEYAGIQYASQQGIIRQNMYFNEAGTELSLTAYSGEAQFSTENRVYNNDFDRSSWSGIEIAGYEGTGYEYSGNLIQNNILTGSVYVDYDSRFGFLQYVLAGKPTQFWVDGGATPSSPPPANSFVCQSNDIFYSTPGTTWTILETPWNGTSQTNYPTPENVAWFQTNQPRLFFSNLELNPLYVNPTGTTPDYHLQSASPMIGAGAFLTQTTSGGTNTTTLPVQDVLWFFDGYGIPGEVGDVIQLQGQTQTARIVSINYASEQLTLDTPLTFTAGQGVALAYNGSAPDMGALPYQATASYALNVASTPPTGVAITGTYAGTTNYRATGISAGASINLVAPATDPTGYTFYGWTVNGVPQPAGQKNITFTMPTAGAFSAMPPPMQTTVVAVYYNGQWTLQIQAPSNTAYGTTTAGTGSYVYSVGCPAALVTGNPMNGYVFSSWTGTAVSGSATANPIAVASGTANQTLTLQPVFATTWTLNIVAPSGSGSTNPATGSYAETVGSASASIQATAASGWAFAYWTGSAAPGQPTTNPITIPSPTLAQTLTLQAVFVQQWTLQIQAQSGSGTTSPGVATYTYAVGASSNPVTAVPQTGYSLSHWTGTAVSGSPTTNPIAISTGTAGQTLTLQAVFAPSNTYTLNVQSTPPTGLGIGSTTSDGGTTNYSVSSLSSGASVNLSAPATDPTGFTFSQWTLNSVAQTAGTKAITFTMPAAAETAVATYTTNTYTLNVQSTPPTGLAIGSSTGDGGTTNYSVSSVSYGASVNLSAPATDPTGYTFSKWTLNSVAQTAGTKAITFTMPAAAETAVATYTTNTYALAVQSTPPTGVAIGSSTGDGGTTNYSVASVNVGASVNLSAPATDPTGYTFSQWTLNSVAQTAGTKAITFTMPAGAETAVATYTTNTYALTVQSTPPTGVGIGSSTGDGGTTNYSVSSVSYGASVNLSAPAADPTGYTFSKWTLNSVAQTAGTKAITFSMPANAETAVATYTTNTYALTVQSTPLTGVGIGSSTGDGGTTNYSVSSVSYGSSVNLSAPATDPTGYTFSQWTLNSVAQTAGTKAITFSMPASAETAVATYTTNTYTLTVQSTPPTGLTIGSSTADGGTTNYSVSSVSYGASVNLSAPAADPTGYTFSKWTLNSVAQTAGTKAITFSMPASAETAVATYTTNTYTLTVQSTPPTGLTIGSSTADGGTTNYSVSSVSYGASVNLSAPAADPTGYTFSKWTLNSVAQTAGTKAITFSMPANAETAVATYTTNTYALSVQSMPPTGLTIGSSTSDGGTTNYSVSSVSYGSSVNLSAPSADPTGYTFSQWTLNSVAQTAGTKAITFTMPASAETAVATYTTNTYALTVQSTPPTGLAIGSSTADGGTTNYSISSVSYGASVNLSAPATDPSGDYSFANWSLNGVNQTAGQMALTFSMPAGAETAVATYAANAYALTVQSSGPTGVAIGSSTGDGGTTNYTLSAVVYGTTVDLSAPATDPAGYLFEQWTLNGISQTALQKDLTFPMPAGAETAVATYAPAVTLTVQSTPIAGVAISSANGHGGTTNYTLSPLASGTTVTLTAPTNDPPGYVFSLWLLNGRPQPASRRTVSFSMNASTTAVASYAPITLAVQSSSVAGVAISSVNGHGGTTNYTLSPIVSGTTITLTAPTNDPPGYVFSLWTLNGSPQPAAKKTVSFTMKGTTTAMASYSPITLAVQSSPVTGVAITGTYPGTTDYDQSPIVSRTSVTLTAPAADPAGYVFSNWTINGTAQTAGVKTQTIVVRGTTTAVAEYTVETFALGVQSTPPTGLAIGSTSGQGGTTNYSLASVPYGTSVNLSAPASDPSGAYTFASWTLNGLGQTAGQSQLTFTMPASAETAVAVYQQIESGVMEGAQAKPVSGAQSTSDGAAAGAAIPLTVQTTPGTGVLIGSPTGQGGTSNYTVPLPASGLQVTLTAPASDPAGRPFWQWMINGAAQPPGRQTATFAVGSATTAVAVYVPSTGSGAVIGSPKSLLATPKR